MISWKLAHQKAYYGADTPWETFMGPDWHYTNLWSWLCHHFCYEQKERCIWLQKGMFSWALVHDRDGSILRWALSQGFLTRPSGTGLQSSAGFYSCGEIYLFFVWCLTLIYFMEELKEACISWIDIDMCINERCAARIMKKLKSTSNQKSVKSQKSFSTNYTFLVCWTLSGMGWIFGRYLIDETFFLLWLGRNGLSWVGGIYNKVSWLMNFLREAPPPFLPHHLFTYFSSPSVQKVNCKTF